MLACKRTVFAYLFGAEAICFGQFSSNIQGVVQEGETFILDTKLQAARTALRNGRSVNSTAGPHRSLRARARSCTMCSPVASFHLAPQRFIRTSNRLLQVASALPLPSGRPSRRARA